VSSDFEQRYRILGSRDPRFDGWFFVAVTSTGIYCRPSCPAITPKRSNVRFYATAAAAQGGGFRACIRCRPDASPGSPEWNLRADVAARAMRLVADGIVDREGVSGLASRLAYSERNLHRVLIAEVGTGALALARAQRAQTARLLIETTELSMADVAFAAGFASIRQFNDTFRTVFALTPSALRKRTGRADERTSGVISLRLAARRPFAGEDLFAFLTLRAVPGVEAVNDGVYSRGLRLLHGEGVVELEPEQGCVRASMYLTDLRDLRTAISRCRRLLDLDADPEAVDSALGQDPLLSSVVRGILGRRVPGCVDGYELAVRAIVGQQVSVAGARSVTGRMVLEAGTPLRAPRPNLTHLFPNPQELLNAPEAAFAMPDSRRRAILALSEALASGGLTIDAGSDPEEIEAKLLSLPGIGPWTCAYVSMRALGNVDAFLPTDLGVRRALGWLGEAEDPESVTRLAERWRPWRAYAVRHLWSMEEAGKRAQRAREPKPKRILKGADAA